MVTLFALVQIILLCVVLALAAESNGKLQQLECADEPPPVYAGGRWR